MGQLTPDLEERGELDRRGFADRAPEQSPLGGGIEAVAVLDDVAGELPAPGAREGVLPGLGFEPVKQLRFELDEEQHFRGDPVRRAPGAPVPGVDPDLQMDEAVAERRRHAVHDGAGGIPVAAGDQGCALGQLVLAALALQEELVERRLHHRHGGRQLFQVDEPGAGIVRRRQEDRRRPARAVGAVAPGDAPQIDGVEEERPDVDIPAVGGRGDLPGDHRFGRPGWSPDHGRLAGLDQEGEDLGELARAQRVVGGDGLGKGHGRAPEWRGDSAGHPHRAPSRHRDLRGPLLVLVGGL